MFCEELTGERNL